ncbi:hypothetical protein [Corynebacterium minutissimum]|uniref:hypothetical protein n=1 Tax=Corynebacterium minutissimum TaxID=38301 RepID=UPI001EF1F521|nr:hypothetical protein [Corynebacterium minutissimum]MCG7229259.1 hypothetical protein [Corynebacterium minutissimum]
MIAASSSIMVHAYRPLSVHSAVKAQRNETATFDFEYHADDEHYHRAATVKLTSLKPIEQSEFLESYKNSFEYEFPYPELIEKAEFLEATVTWAADPEVPLDNCSVRLRDADGLEQFNFLSNSPSDGPKETAFSLGCEPHGAFGPIALDPFDSYPNIIPEPSPRPREWEMTYHFLVTPGFKPKELVIKWEGPREVRLLAEA